MCCRRSSGVFGAGGFAGPLELDAFGELDVLGELDVPGMLAGVFSPPGCGSLFLISVMSSARSVERMIAAAATIRSPS
jgi:hypothetical protein